MTKRSAEERALLLGEFDGSGMSQAEFCREKEINIQTFSGWVKAARGEKEVEGTKFISLTAKPEERTIRRAVLEVTFPDGTVARVSGDA